MSVVFWKFTSIVSCCYLLSIFDFACGISKSVYVINCKTRFTLLHFLYLVYIHVLTIPSDWVSKYCNKPFARVIWFVFLIILRTVINTKWHSTWNTLFEVEPHVDVCKYGQIEDIIRKVTLCFINRVWFGVVSLTSWSLSEDCNGHNFFP